MMKKDYMCSECGFKKIIDTNHYGECYSLGGYNKCPECPPYVPAEGQALPHNLTTWECLETDPKCPCGRGQDWERQYDYHGIYCGKMCDKCHGEKYRQDDYTQDTDECIGDY